MAKTATSKDFSADEEVKRIEAALRLLDLDTADEIIGKYPQEEAVLIEGVRAAMHMLYGLVKVYGRRRRRRLFAVGKTLQVIRQIVHYAYALGIRRGRTEAEGGGKGT